VLKKSIAWASLLRQLSWISSPPKEANRSAMAVMHRNAAEMRNAFIDLSRVA
jgi:hypothetical protein